MTTTQCHKCRGTGMYGAMYRSAGKCYACNGTGRAGYQPTVYQARMVRRDKNAAWAVNAQARLKAFEAKQKEEKGDE